MKKFQYIPKPKTYVMFRMYAETRDMFKFLAAHYGLSVIELLKQLAEQLLAYVEEEAEDVSTDQEVPIPVGQEGVKPEAVENPETVRHNTTRTWADVPTGEANSSRVSGEPDTVHPRPEETD